MSAPKTEDLAPVLAQDLADAVRRHREAEREAERKKREEEKRRRAESAKQFIDEFRTMRWSSDAMLKARKGETRCSIMLPQCLEFADIKQLRAIAEAHGFKTEVHSHEETDMGPAFRCLAVTWEHLV